MPDEWKVNPNELRQKDTDVNYTKKNGRPSYGYKNHVNAVAEYKLIWAYEITLASAADVSVLPYLLMSPGISPEVFADRAYWSQAVEAMLKERGYTSRIMRRGTKQAPLTDEQKKENRRRSRVRVEHVFGSIRNELCGNQVRCIGIVRATAQVGLKNLAYNMRRIVTLSTCVRRSPQGGLCPPSAPPREEKRGGPKAKSGGFRPQFGENPGSPGKISPETPEIRDFGKKSRRSRIYRGVYSPHSRNSNCPAIIEHAPPMIYETIIAQ